VIAEIVFVFAVFMFVASAWNIIIELADALRYGKPWQTRVPGINAVCAAYIVWFLAAQ